MSFDHEGAGKALVSFGDGSAIVKGDGSLAEEELLLERLREGGCDDEKAEGIARALLSQGLTVAASADASDPRTMGEETFQSFVDAQSGN